VFYIIDRKPEPLFLLMFGQHGKSDNRLVPFGDGKKTAKFGSPAALLDSLSPDVPNEVIDSIRKDLIEPAMPQQSASPGEQIRAGMPGLSGGCSSNVGL
jgi:hypothetical protein